MKKQLINEAFRLQTLAGIKPINSLNEDTAGFHEFMDVVDSMYKPGTPEHAKLSKAVEDALDKFNVILLSVNFQIDAAKNLYSNNDDKYKTILSINDDVSAFVKKHKKNTSKTKKGPGAASTKSAVVSKAGR